MTSEPTVTHAARKNAFLVAIPTAVLFGCVSAFWGLNTVAMRVAGRYVPPLTVATWRSVVGGVLLLLLARRRRADWPRRRDEWKGVIALGLMMTGAATAFLFLAAKNAPAGVISILANTMPLFVAILAPLLIGEPTSGRAWLGVAVGMAGTMLVAWRAIEGDVKPIGIVYGILGSLTSAIGSILYKRNPMPRLDRTMAVAVQLLVSSVFLAIVAIPDDRSHMTFPWMFIVSFVYLSVLGLAVSFVFFAELVTRGSGLQASAVAYLSTVLGVLFGAIFLDERLAWTTLLGGAIAIGGVALVQTSARLRR
jgi:drug/metabolite transporter (DMT)-like permease